MSLQLGKELVTIEETRSFLSIQCGLDRLPQLLFGKAGW